uniref:complement component 1 Q subcomponent-binding protein, mitochondrial n=1 Tax=Myxine glutinosa TaxID=7769 RepID=UPI00358E832D
MFLRSLLRVIPRVPFGPAIRHGSQFGPARHLSALGLSTRGGLLQHTASCGCGCGCVCGLHTESDRAFSEFLVEEIKEEHTIKKHDKLPQISGWVTKLNGTEVKILRNLPSETVSVTFNINNSIPPAFDVADEEGKKEEDAEESEPDMESLPNFVVEVEKKDVKHSLVFDCHFPEDEMSGEDDTASPHIFAIRDVSFQSPQETEWKETAYTLSTDMLDLALYDHLMDFLSERGVDNAFADQLVELSTAVEHQSYINFLERLKDFIKS